MSRPRWSGRAATGALLAATTTLLVLGGGSSKSAFTGSIRNSANSVSVAYDTCRTANLADKPTRLYSLASTGGGTNQGSAGAGTDATFIGNILGAFASGGGCLKDPQSHYTLTAGLVGVAARWVTTAGTTPISAGMALSQEVWFKTSTKGGQLTGFGDSNGGALGTTQSTSTALQVFLTDNGQIDFATGAGGGTKTELLTPAGRNYADGAWHQVVAAYNGGVKQLYVDGQLLASGSGATVALTGYWRLGFDRLSGWNNKSSISYLEGGLQWAALYPTAPDRSPSCSAPQGRHRLIGVPDAVARPVDRQYLAP